jgi:Plasmid replication protein.
MAEKKRPQKEERTRNWTFIVYPESAPENWREVLDSYHVPWVESPLHDRDVNADGELKKAHWHVALLFDGVKTMSQIQEISEKIMATVPQKVANAKGMIRYFAHLDNPEKFQYDRSGIVGHGGADVVSMLEVTKKERYTLIREMIEYIRENKVTEFVDLMNYASEERFDDWFPLLCDNSSYVINQYIKSNRHRGK